MPSDTKRPEFVQLAIDRLWETVPPLWNMIRSNLRATAADNFAIGVEQFHILRHIRKGINTVSDLAAARGISRPGISQAVDILVAKGFISRHQDPDDRRQVILRLTQEGDDLLNYVFQQNRSWLMEQMSALGDDELECIIEAMGSLKKLLAERALSR